MTGANETLLAGLPDQVRRLLVEPPAMEKMLIELNLAWPGLTAGLARMADAVRLFVITWDPLERRVDRAGGFATTNGGSADLEIVVYLPTWSLVRLATERDSTLAATLGAMAGSAVVTASHHEETVNSSRYPGLAARGVVPDLVSDLAAGGTLGAAKITAVTDKWQPIGLGAITDLAQHAFGPVDLDRSPVELTATTAVRQGCPACAGGRFGFPAALAQAKHSMCPAHHHEAESVISRRLARANASNPDGWAAITDATLRIDRPHIPNGLAAGLPSAETSIYDIPAPTEQLAERAERVIEAARWFRNRADAFALALGQEPHLAGQLPDWLANLILDLGRAGLGPQAARVGDALGQVDPSQQAFFEGDVCVALAVAGLPDQARARIATNLARWPHDLWTHVHAGETFTAIADLKAAEEHFDAAMRMADASGDADAMADVVDRIRMATWQATAGERTHPAGQRRQPKRKLSKTQRKRQANPKRGK